MVPTGERPRKPAGPGCRPRCPWGRRTGARDRPGSRHSSRGVREHEADHPTSSWGPAPWGAAAQLWRESRTRPETVDKEKRSRCEGVQDAGAAGPRGWEAVGAEGMVLSRVPRRREKSGTLERAW